MKQRRRTLKSISKSTDAVANPEFTAEATEVHQKAAEKTLVFLRSSAKTSASNFRRIQSLDAL